MPSPFRRCNLIAAVLVTVLAGPVGNALAQAQDASTVVYVGGDDLVVKTADGKLLNYTIPSDYRFQMGGGKVPLSALKPGTVLSERVVTGSDPAPVASVKVVKGKVYASTPPDGLTLSLADGIKELSVPTGTLFSVNGKALPLAQLKPEMVVDATIVTTGAAPEGSAVATPPMIGALLVANAPAGEDLPSAGTNLPLFGLLGACLLSLGAGLMFFRRPARPRV